MRKECPQSRIDPAPVSKGTYSSQRIACPTCGVAITVHPNGAVPRHRQPQ